MEINDTNGKLKNYYSGNRFIFVDDSVINESCSNKSKLNLNKENTSMLDNNIKLSIKEVCWLSESHTNKSNTTKTHFSDHSGINGALCELENKNPSNINFSHLSINSIRNMFEDLREIIDGNIDALSVAETKADSSFQPAFWRIEGVGY